MRLYMFPLTDLFLLMTINTINSLVRRPGLWATAKLIVVIPLVFNFVRLSLAQESAPNHSLQSDASERFSSYDEAKNYVKSHYSSESLDTSSSSFIKSAVYFPTGEVGFLILGMQNKEYIFSMVPLRIWEGFKDANSKGQYFNQFLKGRFILELKNST